MRNSSNENRQNYRRNNITPSDSVLRRIQFFFNAIQRTTDAYCFVADIKLNLVMVSSNLANDFDLPAEVFEDMDSSWIPLIHPDDVEKFKTSMANMFPQGDRPALTNSHDVVYRVRRKDGEYCWIRCRGILSHDRRSGEPFMFVGMMTTLSTMSEADHVTGLLGKSRFEHAVRKALELYHSDDVAGAVMVFGIDNFKMVNETYNRMAGDRLLRQVARCVESVLPEVQLLYKLDGDEFGIVCPGVDEADCEELYRMVQRALYSVKGIDGHKLVCTVSAGTVMYPQGGKDYLVLHKHAEAALDLAKQAGKNRNCIFTREQYNRWLRSMSLRDEMSESVDNDFKGFELYFQPQVDAKTHKIIGAEALLRWFNSNGRMVSPMEFIPILEETKLILPVGRWILETAIKQCKAWQEKMPGFRMSINLSYEQLRDSSMRIFIEECIRKYDIDPKCIVLELTESTIMSDWSFINEQFAALRDVGVMIAMDDFGTGYSSLACLKNLTCDIVKIDRAFVTNILINEFDKQLVKYTVELCHSIGIKCCIEGVETQEEYEIVTESCKADSIQGYLFGRPEPKSIFEEKFLNVQ